MSKDKNCLVLLSGGQDSATCLAWAANRFGGVFTLSFNYGQRHLDELVFAKKLSRLAGARDHETLDIQAFSQIGDSALLTKHENISIRHRGNKDLPASFVPGRNYILLGLAAAYAFNMRINDLVGGMCETDYSGYPDCRRESLDAVELALFRCLDYRIDIHTPLMHLSKALTVKMMGQLGKLDWYEHTQTCYEGMRPPCRNCPACDLRAKGFDEAGISDPLLK
jgi:7-cyano-7-deazaguanine synthase